MAVPLLFCTRMPAFPTSSVSSTLKHALYTDYFCPVVPVPSPALYYTNPSATLLCFFLCSTKYPNSPHTLQSLILDEFFL